MSQVRNPTAMTGKKKKQAEQTYLNSFQPVGISGRPKLVPALQSRLRNEVLATTADSQQ